ncbi:hypothetical protein TOPH_05147 [Tolypocladium ophioglossoides CBS 100239]|uniref:Uncharacterized protein n=1 Tax=Tolypocladium ophioglossoides (strain CBS 100239) TaxID=1163406 RepID=A0A0L0N899_TOLOC|nr:hypothetical protein TOPH_05147 [Tolypocladium ophioglossoides CBS 100239]
MVDHFRLRWLKWLNLRKLCMGQEHFSKLVTLKYAPSTEYSVPNYKVLSFRRQPIISNSTEPGHTGRCLDPRHRLIAQQPFPLPFASD